MHLNKQIYLSYINSKYTYKLSLISIKQWRYFIRLFLIIFALLAAWYLIFTISNLLIINTRAVAINERNLSVNEPINIKFNQLIKAPKVRLAPSQTGTWSVKKSINGSVLSFTPNSKILSSGTTYKIDISEIQTISGKKLSNQSFTAVTESASDVDAIYPKDQDSSVKRLTKLGIILKSKNRNMRSFTAKLEPATTQLNMINSKDDKTFEWSTKDPLKQGQEYSFTVIDNNNPTNEIVAKTSFKIASAPIVMQATQKSLFYDNEKIYIKFSKSMVKVPKVLTGINGTGDWKSDTEYEFSPQNLVVNQKYNYTLEPNLFATDTSVIENAESYYFYTPGAVKPVISNIGKDASTNPRIDIRFDQPVKRSTVETRISINPAAAGGLTWLSDTYAYFSPQNLEEQTTYTVTVASGVEPIRFGLPSNTVSMVFTTKPPIVKLNVPLYRQQHISSCEASAARMALAYRGIFANDADIVQRFGYNPRPLYKSTNTWDDPNEMYVGNINGAQPKLEGYGAYAGPIAKGIKSYGIDAQAIYNVNAINIAEQIHSGNPVIIIGTWGGAPKRVNWNGPNGVVEAWYGEHARVVVGVVGKANNPVGFYINDPLSSKQMYWTVARLNDDINTIPQVPAQAVIVK